MNAKTMFLSFIPWAAFTVLAGHGTELVGPAALVATVLAVGLVVRASRRSSVKIIDVASLATFGALTVAAFAGGDSLRQDIADYGRGGAALVLAAVMLGSLLVVPFTEQYARESVPQQFWSSPRFRAVNRQVSMVWGIAMLAMAGGHLCSGYFAAAGELSHRGNLLLNWVLPALLVLAAMKQTKQLLGARPDTATAEAAVRAQR